MFFGQEAVRYCHELPIRLKFTITDIAWVVYKGKTAGSLQEHYIGLIHTKSLEQFIFHKNSTAKLNHISFSRKKKEFDI